MKLTVFQSDKGDCLLLADRDEKTHVLVDGGMSTSFREHTAATLGDLRERGIDLDLIYISHIDEDHISGVLELLKTEVAWRVYDYQVQSSGPRKTAPKEPPTPRPPAVKEIWHNAFSRLISENDGALSETIASAAIALRGAPDPSDQRLAASYSNITNGVSDAIELGYRASPEQLGIPINAAFDGKLAVLGTKPKTIRRGSLTFSLLAPREVDLGKLREVWNKWLRDNKAALGRISARMNAEVDKLGANEIGALIRGLELQAEELGDRGQVTEANLASLMFMVEEEGRTLLLTGDGHSDEVLSGLEAAGKLAEGDSMHVDVLKVPHHGSEFNLNAKFCERLSADHYIFCANGEHANPDLRILELILDSRLDAGTATANDQGDLSTLDEETARRRTESFHFWFNSSSKAEGADAEHMNEVEVTMKARARASKGRFSCSFLTDHQFELEI